MYRRRRPQREKICFSFDAFLDVVANVIGIIIRLILVTWVGARSYTAAMQFAHEEPAPIPQVESVPRPLPPPLPPPRLTDDPLHHKLELARQEMEVARRQLLDKLHNLEGTQEKTQRTRQELDHLAQKNREIESAQSALEKELQAKGQKVEKAALSLEGLRQRGRELSDEIKKVASLPVRTKELRYHTPVSRVVQGDEVHFECRGGKVTFIDLPAFLHEVTDSMEAVAEVLRKDYKVTRTTSPVGAFRLHYIFERERGLMESPHGFRYGLTGWALEPIHPNRGETLQTALAPASDFHRLTDALDPNQTVVTFWVYPDSFELFRVLRDHLYERQVEVAGRPLPMDSPISASRNGSKSRGQ